MTEKELEKIYSEAYRAVYWTAFQLLKNEADAEDIVQDTFVALIESYDTIEDKTKVTSWLKKTAANRSLNRLTRTKTDNVEDGFFEDVEAVPEDFLPDTIVESEQMRKIVMDIIDKSLSEDIRRTLILFYFDEMSTKEVAEALNVPQGTVSRRINFAKNKIKKEVEKYEKETGAKLFSMALPFLSQLFMKEAEQVPFRPMPAKLINLSASAKAPANGAATKIAVSAAKKGTGIMINKIIIGSIAAGVITVAAVGGAVYFVTRNADVKPEVTTEEIEEVEESEEITSATEETTEAAVVTTDTEATETTTEATAATTKVDISEYFDPDADVIVGLPTLCGHTISLPCTVGDLKAIGFTTDGSAFAGQMTMDIEYEVYNETWEEMETVTDEIICFVEGPDYESDDVSDDVIVYEITFGEDFVVNGMSWGTREDEFVSNTGTPSYVDRTDNEFRRCAYYYLDENGNCYKLRFFQFIGSDEEPILGMVTYSTPEAWQYWCLTDY